VTMFRLRGRSTAERDLIPEVSSSEGVETSKDKKHFEGRARFDPNLPVDEIELVGATLANGNSEKGIRAKVALTEDDSPYPEV
jgi:hypothetical protein